MAFFVGICMWKCGGYAALSNFLLTSVWKSCHHEQPFLGRSVLSLTTKRNIKWPPSQSRIAITGSVQQVERCLHPVGPFSTASTPHCQELWQRSCDLSVSTASVSIAFHSPVDRAPQFALATTNQWPDLLFEDNVINP